MSTQGAPISTLEPQAKESTKLPRKLKKQMGEKANPAGSPSQPSRAASAAKPRPATRPHAEHQPKAASRPAKRPARIAKSKALATLANKLKTQHSDIYTQAADPQVDPATLAEEIAQGPFRAALAKCRGYEPHLLMESVIVDYIRVEHPVVEPMIKPEKETKPKKLTPAQEAQRQQSLSRAPQPATHTASGYTPPKGAPKSVPCRKTYKDRQIVEDALKVLFRDNPKLKEMFCRASHDGAIKKLLRTNAHIRRLSKSLQREMAAPSRVNQYVELAVRGLVAQYRIEIEEAERIAAIQAAARHDERRLTAIQASAAHVKALNRKANKGVIPRGLRNEMTWA